MTLTEMIRAHDGGVPTTEWLAQLNWAMGNEKDPKRKVWWSNVIMALAGDLNAAWRLLPEGWSWRGLYTQTPHGWCADAYSPKTDVYWGQHKSLPCAMALAALQAWGIE